MPRGKSSKKAISDLDRPDFDVEIVQLKLGQRKVARKEGIPLKKINSACKMWMDMGFYCAVYPAPYFMKPDGSNFQFSPDGDRKSVFIGRTPEDAVEGMFTMWHERVGERENLLTRDTAEILGYPYCCSVSYDVLVDERLPFDAYLSAAVNTKKNFFPLLTPAARFIAHFPCSFDCPSSIRLAAVVFEYIKKNNPEFHQQNEPLLKKPVLILKTGQIITFNGCLDDKRLDFSNITCHRGDVAEDFKMWLRGAVVVRVSDDGKSLIRQDGVEWEGTQFLVLRWDGSLLQPRKYLESICSYDREKRRNFGDVECYQFFSAVREILKETGRGYWKIRQKSFDFKVGVAEFTVTVYGMSSGGVVEVFVSVYPPGNDPRLGAECPEKIRFSVSEESFNKVDPENRILLKSLTERGKESAPSA
ncbi:MAG: hypothetical protein AB1546_03400 [bacterium]